MTQSEVLQFAKENGAKQVDVRFADIPGLQHHISYPIGELNEGSFTDGFGIDGSSILRRRLWIPSWRRPLLSCWETFGIR
jgi:glutamine synthetase